MTVSAYQQIVAMAAAVHGHGSSTFNINSHQILFTQFFGRHSMASRIFISTSEPLPCQQEGKEGVRGYTVCVTQEEIEKGSSQVPALTKNARIPQECLSDQMIVPDVMDILMDISHRL